MRIWIGVAIILATGTVVAGSLPAQTTPPSPGKVAFAACAACHATTPNTILLGPSLFGVVNRKIASAQRFAYSSGLKGKAGKWDERSLDAFLTNPRAFAPGNRMAYPGMADPAKRRALIDYLKTLRSKT